MKKLVMLLVVLALTAGLAVFASAATDNTAVTVTVDYVDLLEAPATAALTLTTATPGATNYDQGTLTQAGVLKYTHNSTTAKKITAAAVADVGNPTNNVTLQTQIVTGGAMSNMVTAGTDQSGVLLWDNITADGYNYDLSWLVDATVAGTTAGANINQNYVWTITFTSADH